MMTPSGEKSWVLAMEYIDGDNVARFAYKLQIKSLTEDAPLMEENVEILGSVVGFSLFVHKDTF